MPRGRQGFAVRQMHRFCGAPGTVAQWRPSRTVHPRQYAPTRHVVLAAPRQPPGSAPGSGPGSVPGRYPRQCPRQCPRRQCPRQCALRLEPAAAGPVVLKRVVELVGDRGDPGLVDAAEAALRVAAGDEDAPAADRRDDRAARGGWKHLLELHPPCTAGSVPPSASVSSNDFEQHVNGRARARAMG